jgi:nucleoside-diphosphate-sugar epimerase
VITVLGSSGFVGSHLVEKLKKTGMDFYNPGRDENIKNRNLGDIIYCIGMTADFRKKPFETAEAHVCLLNDILKNGKFNSLTYLSSTRVYIRSKEKEVFEDSPINISITDPDELYTLTKLTGERLCLSSGCNIRIARLSNVYGKDYLSENFINDIIKKIIERGDVKFFTTSTSAKDYISIESVTDLLIALAKKGNNEIYNIASGENISNAEIIEMLKIYFDFKYSFDEQAKEIIFPRINIDKIKNQFNYSPSDNKEYLFQLIKTYSNDKNR